MAKLSFGVTGPTGVLDVSIMIADTDMPRIMSYLMASPYGQVTENVVTTVPDPSWTPDPGESEADRPMIADPDWVASEEQPEAPMIPDASWTPRPPQTDADNPGMQVQQWVTRPATPDETAANYARAILGQLLSETVNWEKAQAAAAAASAVAPIEPV